MPSHESLFGGVTQIELRDGRTVRLEVDESFLVLHVSNEEVAIPYPNAGYAGHELLASPDERYVVLWLYSGQSEIGYELFALDPARRVASFPYVYGEGSGPVFSTDSRYLALAWTTNGPLNLEDLPLDEAGLTRAEHEIDWAMVRVLDLHDLSARTCRVCVRVPAGSYYERDEFFEAGHLRFASDGSLRLGLPWAPPIELPRDLPATISVCGPPLGPIA